MKPETAKLVTFGARGDTVHISKGCTISGYGSPERPHAAEIRDGKDLVIPDGTPVIDVRPAIDTPEGFSWVFKGPLVNVDLPDDGIDYCPEPSPLMACAMAGTEFGTLLAIQHVQKRESPKSAGSLDSVSISVFVRGWKEHGARIGHYENSQIVWD